MVDFKPGLITAPTLPIRPTIFPHTVTEPTVPLVPVVPFVPTVPLVPDVIVEPKPEPEPELPHQEDFMPPEEYPHESPLVPTIPVEPAQEEMMPLPIFGQPTFPVIIGGGAEKPISTKPVPTPVEEEPVATKPPSGGGGFDIGMPTRPPAGGSQEPGDYFNEEPGFGPDYPDEEIYGPPSPQPPGYGDEPSQWGDVPGQPPQESYPVLPTPPVDQYYPDQGSGPGYQEPGYPTPASEIPWKWIALIGLGVFLLKK